ncbi:MFS transporter [Pseudomonas sp. O230]|uniref:MFS transporter n=1 Tax=Pseudomonas sp. O230 TaxID=3159450 RepID=UPI00387B22AF
MYKFNILNHFVVGTLGPNLWRFQLSFFILTLGIRANQLAIAWWTLQETNCAACFSAMVACAISAEILAKPLLGWVADRYCKIQVILIGNILSAGSVLALLTLSLLNEFNAIAVGSLMVIGSIVIGVRDPIQSSIIPSLVDKEQVPLAFRSKAIMSSLATLIGPVIAGGLISGLGISMALGVDLLAIVLAARLVSSAVVKQSASNLMTESRISLILSGFRIAYRIKIEFYLSILAMIVNFALFPFFAILVPLYVKDILSLPVWYVGLLDSAFGLGILVGSYYFIGWLENKVPRDVCISVGFSLLGCNLLITGLLNSPWLLPIVFFCGGVGLMLVNVHASTVRTLATPQQYRNRMSATVAFFSALASPIGSIVVGLYTEKTNLNLTIILFGGLISTLSMIVFLIPQFKLVMRTSNKKLDEVYREIYPTAFHDTAH